ncbi:MAG: LytTR family transcriptional regulator DNA-binding domain-containing protein [Cellvibrionaceae bacterium]|nr:LytTR family transcriptional regulator DNA-binding domain-containing protein [Cellvibrionaceae bacterium]
MVNASLISAAKTLNNGEYMLTLANKKQLKVSRSYRDKIKNLLK